MEGLDLLIALGAPDNFVDRYYDGTKLMILPSITGGL